MTAFSNLTMAFLSVPFRTTESSWTKVLAAASPDFRKWQVVPTLAVGVNTIDIILQALENTATRHSRSESRYENYGHSRSDNALERRRRFQNFLSRSLPLWPITNAMAGNLPFSNFSTLAWMHGSIVLSALILSESPRCSESLIVMYDTTGYKLT
jgi:hypothetical protein